METPPKHRLEKARQATVESLELNTPTVEATYSAVVELLSDALDTPITLFSVIDGERQFFKSKQGLPADETPRDISFCAHAIVQEGKDFFIINNPQEDPRFSDNPLVTGDPNIRFYAGAVVKAPNNLPVGTVCAIDTQPRQLTKREKRHLLNAKLLMESALTLRAQSLRDHLTGLYNRRHFDAMLDVEWRRAYRHVAPMGVLMVDVDHFKAYNDKFGHQAGDECLRRIAAAMANVLNRSGDLLARYGGEEFVAILPGTPIDSLQELGDRLREVVRSLGIESGKSASEVVTVSVGGAILPDKQSLARGHEPLVGAADEALYEAKDAGRDRCIVRDLGKD